ncbi:MAG: DUF2461 domain-containing protein [Clostridia bacterium]|nr:DUF2461 domain-containing protein [Clostridia bacterium]
MFTGFPKGTEEFFLDIRFHNNATYYHENVERYRSEVQAPFYAFIEDLLPTLVHIDPRMEIRPYKILSRLRRDTRFTKDKTPYRDHLWTFFHREAEPREKSLGFWFEYGPGRLTWGLGSWGENRPLMDRFRRELAAKPSYYRGLIDSCGLPERHLMLSSDGFKRIAIPEGLPQALEPWYRSKDFGLIQTYPDIREASSRDILTHVRGDYLAMAPIYRMLQGMQDALNEEEESVQEKQ